MEKSKVSLIRCSRYDTQDVEKAVGLAVDILGGPEAFARKGDRVLIKPNLLTDALPEEGVDTHPEVVRAVIRLFKPLASRIYCGDGPNVWGEKKDVERVYEVSGMKKVCREEGIEMVAFTVPKMRSGYPLTEWLEKTDRLINVPKFKTHSYTILTAGVKNLFGLVVGMNKMKIHKDFPSPAGLSRALLDIYESRKPDLTILDGIMAMEGEGPGSCGTVRPMELVAAAQDALALDFVLAVIMGLVPEDIPTIREAGRRGLFPETFSDIDIKGEDIRFFVAKDYRLPRTSFLNRMPDWAAVIARKMLRMKVCVIQDLCRACQKCRQSCPAEACRMEGGRMIIDESKCIFCLCCQEICPHKAIEVKKNFFLRMMTR
ncbi:MAG: DUF362 domain-containing protein [Candidatus Omnitrophota bacterium]